MENNKNVILRGNIVYSLNEKELFTLPQGYLVCEEGICKGVFETIPLEYNHLPIVDYGNHVLIPGLVDLHLHAPQYMFRGNGMDMELLPWLETYAFVEESKYCDLDYATKAYSMFTNDLLKSPTTHAAIFATLHVPATKILMQQLESTGINAFVGKVNMDRNSPDNLRETAEDSLADTKSWLDECLNHYENVHPILTPRFIPSCSDALLEGLDSLLRQYHLPVQSHLSENPSEIAWVQELHPDTSCYADAYNKYHLFGEPNPTIMAHCVHSDENEINLLKNNHVYVAHCPESNINLSSGIAPIRHMLDVGVHVGLGTDIAAGSSLSLFKAMVNAIQVSKLYARLIDATAKPLTVPEVFYMATKGGGSFWGNVGSFEQGYSCNVVVIDDMSLATLDPLTLVQRLERIIYLSDDRNIVAKYVDGKKIL
ncbi:MAG: amidohydrolase family protein [Cellulosilyticaceae bacterium]